MGLLLTPSDWIVRWSHLLPPHGTVLDVACGAGRHVRWFAQRGHHVTGIDQNVAHGEPIKAAKATWVCADIENGPWPLLINGTPQVFDAVIVTNYLWRPLLDTLIASVAPGGVLLYETFTSGNETVGRPTRPDFLLQAGELLQRCSALQVVAYENGYLEHPPRFVQRIAAVRPPTAASDPLNPTRYPL